MLRRATALKRICDRQRVQNAIYRKNSVITYLNTLILNARMSIKVNSLS